MIQIHKDIVQVLKRRNMTADEVAAKLKQSILYIRPRITELRSMHLIERTDERRLNESGKKAYVLKIKA